MTAPATSASPLGGTRDEPAHATPACHRHASIHGTRRCRTCDQPLCSACARHALHRFCPECLSARGRPAERVDVGWLFALWADAVVTAAPRLHRSALPFLAVASAALGTGRAALATGGASGLLDMLLTTLLLSSLATSFRVLPPPATRTWRGVAAFTLAGVAGGIPAAVLAAGVSILLGATGILSGLGALSVGVGAFVWTVVFAVQPVMVAASVTLQRPLPECLLLPLRQGWRAWLVVTVPCGLVMGVMHALTLASAWWTEQGDETALLARTLFRAGAWFLQGSVSLACLRWLLDVERSRR